MQRIVERDVADEVAGAVVLEHAVDETRASIGSAGTDLTAQVRRLEPVVGDRGVARCSAPSMWTSVLMSMPSARFCSISARGSSTESRVFQKSAWLRSTSATWAWRVTARNGTKPSTATSGSGSCRAQPGGRRMPEVGIGVGLAVDEDAGVAEGGKVVRSDGGHTAP